MNINSYYGEFYWDQDKEPSKENTVNVVFCLHDWRQYEGFTEKYKYCAKCDEKDYPNE